MVEKGLEFCVFDPEGDYYGLEHAVAVGDADSRARFERCSKAPLRRRSECCGERCGGQHAGTSTLVCTAAACDVRPARPNRASPLAAARRGAPRYAGDGRGSGHDLLESLLGTVFITVNPELLAAETLRKVEMILAFGDQASETLASFAKALNIRPPVKSPSLSMTNSCSGIALPMSRLVY